MTVNTFRFWTVACDETEYWADGVLAEFAIRRAFGLYLICEGEATYCCSLSPSTWAEALRNVFVCDNDAETYDWSGRTGLGRFIEDNEYEGLESTYLPFIDPAKFDKRLVAGPFEIERDEIDPDAEMDDEEFRRELWNEARERWNTAPDEPDVVGEACCTEWESDMADRRRAEMRPPLDARGQLPLFAHATGMIQATVGRAEGWGKDIEGMRRECAYFAALGWMAPRAWAGMV